MNSPTPPQATTTGVTDAAFDPSGLGSADYEPFVPPSLSVTEDGLVAEGVLPDTALAPPSPEMPSPRGVLLDRAFGFVDLCGFSKFTAEHGTDVASIALSHFRDLLRSVAGNRGVRIAKWLGDGAMLVGVSPGPVVATLAELVVRYPASIRAGVAAGPAMLFEADDYLGEPVNRAARLCAYADPNQLLASPEIVPFLPDWTRAEDVGAMELRGLGVIEGICAIRIEAELRSDMDAPPFPDIDD